LPPCHCADASLPVEPPDASTDPDADAPDASSSSAETLATNLNVMSVAMDSANIYWADAPTSGYGSIMSMPLGGGTPTVIASEQDGPVTLAVRGGYVYWGTLTGEAVMSAPVTGGEPTVLAEFESSPIAIAVDDQSVYFATLGTSGEVAGVVASVPIGGGDVVTIASDQDSPRGIAVDSSNVYWTTADGFVMKASIAGGPATQIVTTESLAGALTVDEKNLYWLTPSGVWTAPLSGLPDGGGPTLIATAQGFNSNEDAIGVEGGAWLAVDATYVYWTDGDSATGTVAAVPLAGGAVTILASGEIQPTGIAVGASGVYWGDLGTYGVTGSGSLRRAGVP
jgi:hypothetical protein